jgi:hypothetical protein
MPRKTKMKGPGIKWLTRAEAKAFVDSAARRVLKISGAKFIANWKSGKYRKLDSDECPGVIELALVAPLPRLSRAGKNRKRSRR